MAGKCCCTTDMIGMMVSEQNAGQSVLLLFEPRQYRYGIAGIDNPASLSANKHPDVIVLEAWNGDGTLHERVTVGLGVSIIATTGLNDLP